MNRGMASIAVVGLMLGFGAGVLEANDQKFVIGIGVGIHSFSDTDDAREGSALFGGEDEITQAGVSHLYGEWYVFDDVGIGVRLISIFAGRTYEDIDEKLEQNVTIGAQLITAQWIAFGSEDYLRIGALGGIGAASYEISETYTAPSGSSVGSYDDSWSSNGSAVLVGGFLDWGADGFGARFGINYLSTDLDPISAPAGEFEVDGSGSHFYFDLRWAFD